MPILLSAPLRYFIRVAVGLRIVSLAYRWRMAVRVDFASTSPWAQGVGRCRAQGAVDGLWPRGRTGAHGPNSPHTPMGPMRSHGHMGPIGPMSSMYPTGPVAPWVSWGPWNSIGPMGAHEPHGLDRAHGGP